MFPDLSNHPGCQTPDFSFKLEKGKTWTIDSLSTPQLSSPSSLTYTISFSPLFPRSPGKLDLYTRTNPLWPEEGTESESGLHVVWLSLWIWTLWWWATKRETPLNQHPSREEDGVHKMLRQWCIQACVACLKQVFPQPNSGTAALRLCKALWDYGRCLMMCNMICIHLPKASWPSLPKHHPGIDSRKCQKPECHQNVRCPVSVFLHYNI